MDWYDKSIICMRFAGILICSIFLSCNPASNDKKSSENQIVFDLLYEYLKQGSFEDNATISSQILPFFYYESQFTKDGYQIPKPWSREGEYTNEIMLINRMNDDRYPPSSINQPGNKYFSTAADSIHLKTQIIYSIKTIKSFEDVSWSDGDSFSRKQKVKGRIIFYLPLFNNDSTEAYLQYDYYSQGFGMGNGAVFCKINNQWRLVKKIHRWMT